MQWAAYTNAVPEDYPPPMTPGAIFYGGTDPGRFVPTYMIYSAKVRPDVYLITQNALADNTFMNITRDLYGDTIYIPSLEDSNEAFRKYVDDVNAGRIQAGADIKIENGKVSVQGVGGVMTINGILAELIFKENKAKHDFYVEESYVIQWMYPYLSPHGIILKLNPEPLAGLDPKLVENDHAFWGWYTKWLLDQRTFQRDICARKSFSKLRSAIAGIYDYRRMYAEAEYAFKQSIELYPLSPEANFRLAQMYMNMQRFDDAETLIRAFAAEDPDNDSAKGFLGQIENTTRMINRRQEIEKKQQDTQQLSADEALELVSIYRASGMQGAYQQLASRLVSDPGLPPQHVLALAGLFAQDQRVEAIDLCAGTIHQARDRQSGCVARFGRGLRLRAAGRRCRQRRPPGHRTGRRPRPRGHHAGHPLPGLVHQPRLPRPVPAPGTAARGAGPLARRCAAEPARHGEIAAVPDSSGSIGFAALTPDAVMDCAEHVSGRRASGICRPLTSYINRVYEVGLEDGGFLIAKFYRPGRWSRAALQDEQDFLLELAADEVSVVAPLADADGKTLHEEGGISFALFPRMGGRPCDEPSRSEWLQIGRLLGRIHQVGARKPAVHRLALDPRKSSLTHLDFLRISGAIPREVEGRYLDTAQRLLDHIAPCSTAWTPSACMATCIA